MRKNILIILAIIALIYPVSALEPVIFIKVGMEENPTKGFYLLPEDAVIEQGQNISFFNDDQNKRWFTVVSEENLFPETTISFRKRVYYEFNEPGTYNFYLKEKPTIKLQLKVVGNGSSDDTGQDTREDSGQTITPEAFRPDLGTVDPWDTIAQLPGFGALMTVLVITLLAIRARF